MESQLAGGRVDGVSSPSRAIDIFLPKANDVSLLPVGSFCGDLAMTRERVGSHQGWAEMKTGLGQPFFG